MRLRTISNASTAGEDNAETARTPGRHHLDRALSMYPDCREPSWVLTYPMRDKKLSTEQPIVDKDLSDESPCIVSGESQRGALHISRGVLRADKVSTIRVPAEWHIVHH